jgi:ABC-2 type transport system permease protein
MKPTKPKLHSMLAIFRREMLTYATTPTAYVFVAVFLFALGVLTFQSGQFFAVGRADLSAFFPYAPWVFLIFMPAVAMRLWAEERRSGMLEVLLTLPASTPALVLGKFLAAWALAAIALALTFPLWVTVNLLGHPDNAAIAVGYGACLLMAGGYLAIGQAMSALTATQVVAFVLGVLVSFLLTAAGSAPALSFLEGRIGAEEADAVAHISILFHFDAATRGVIELRGVFYFLSLIAMFLTFSVLTIDAKREG